MKLFENVAPLPGTFMIASIVGILVSYMFVLKRSFNFGIAFILIFAIMFIASFVSMTRSPVSEKTKVK